MSIPKTRKQWKYNVKGEEGGIDKLSLEEGEIPKLGDNEVLIQVKAVSLNFRDVAIVTDNYPFPVKPDLIPCSDGAGIIISTGPKVTKFAKGDHVIPIFIQSQIAGLVQAYDTTHTLGGPLDGVMSQYMTVNEEGLVRMPKGYDFLQAAALPCAAVTAWNALFGLEGRMVKPGDWVLTQGTGGVSIFALQFAKAAGATVVATTSSSTKADRLKSLGADHIINYRDDPNWGTTARDLTPNKAGFHHIVEVGGPGTLRQSLAAIKMEGVISIIGFVGKGDDMPGMLEALMVSCVVRGIFIGSRAHFEDMVRAIDAHGIKPVVDEKVFGFEELKEAYQYLEAQKHFGKVCLQID